MDAQEQLLVQEALSNGYEFDVVREERPAGRQMDQRDKLFEALELLDSHGAQVLMAVRLDLLSSDPEQITAIVGRSREKGWGIVISGAGIPEATTGGARPLQEVARELSRESRSAQTREGMARLKAEGAVFGRRVDSAFLPTYRDVLAMVERGDSYNSIARSLNADGIATAAGGKWYASTIKAIVSSEAAKRLNPPKVG